MIIGTLRQYRHLVIITALIKQRHPVILNPVCSYVCVHPVRCLICSASHISSMLHGSCSVAQSQFRKFLRFRVAAKIVHSSQPKRFARRNTASLKCGGGVVAELSTKKNRRFVQKSAFFRGIPRPPKCNGGGGVVAERSKIKSVDSAINLFSRRLKQAIKLRRKRIFRRLGIPEGGWDIMMIGL